MFAKLYLRWLEWRATESHVRYIRAYARFMDAELRARSAREK